ncbi:MAG: rhomboid family intramembrane serine protease [Thioalkalispiraceae bacterium]|jgi:membrane associated rhomboid family serine protease
MLRRFIYFPTVVQILLILNGIAFLLLMIAPVQMFENFALWPLGLTGQELYGGLAPRFQIWQLISYSFLHGGVFHLLINMYVLWLFGSRIELAWGSKAFVIYYFVCVIGAGLVQLFVASQSVSTGDIYPTVGASGGVFGLLLAFALTFPNERLMLIFPPVILKAKWLVLIYAAIELYAGVTGTMEGIAHFAHLGGMVFGFLLLLYWGKHPLRR